MPDDRPVYLDYNATTPVDPAVLDAMLPYLSERFGNPSSAHVYGYEAHAAMDDARRSVANLLGASPDDVLFTGGGSEGDNMAIKGVAFANLDSSPHIIANRAEHPVVLNTLSYLKRRFGVTSTIVPVDRFGMVDPDDIRAAITPQTVLITVMHANNEVGTIQPISELARIANEHELALHVDAAQSAGKLALNGTGILADIVTVAGHKLYAPKGV